MLFFIRASPSVNGRFILLIILPYFSSLPRCLKLKLFYYVAPSPAEPVDSVTKSRRERCIVRGVESADKKDTRFKV